MSNATEGVVAPDILTPPLSPYRPSDTLSPENEHPDSKYNNWTMRSFDCKTPLEDIPPWMRIYAESSIETHTFFKFERYEYQELNAWQSMLLKLYRKDLNNVIKYYEDYRVSLVSEICNRASRTPATESTETDGARHEVCELNPKEVFEKYCDLDTPLPTDQTDLKSESSWRTFIPLSGGSDFTLSNNSWSTFIEHDEKDLTDLCYDDDLPIPRLKKDSSKFSDTLMSLPDFPRDDETPILTNMRAPSIQINGMDVTELSTGTINKLLEPRVRGYYSAKVNEINKLLLEMDQSGHCIKYSDGSITPDTSSSSDGAACSSALLPTEQHSESPGPSGLQLSESTSSPLGVETSSSGMSGPQQSSDPGPRRSTSLDPTHKVYSAPMIDRILLELIGETGRVTFTRQTSQPATSQPSPVSRQRVNSYPESKRDDLDPLTPPEEPTQERKVSEDVQVSKIISHFEKLDTSPPNTIDSPSQRQFKRFGKKKEMAKGNETETKERSASEPAVPPCESSPDSHVVRAPCQSSPDSHVFKAPDSTSMGSNNTGTGSTGDFDTPLLKRSPGKRMTKLRASYMHPSHYDQNISNNGDYPSPLHIRSASSRQTPRAQDFPSPYLNRSSSDRPKTMYTSILQEGLSQSATLSDWSSDEGGLFRRGSSKRSSGGVKILSPKLKKKSEPGSQRVKYIEPEASSNKSKKLSKMLSRATSFGRKDKEKSPRYKESKDERKSRSRSVERTDRSSDRRKSDEQPRETAV